MEKTSKEKYAPLLITPDARYTPQTPTDIKMNISLHPRETCTSDVNTEEYSREMDVHDPQINATRILTNITRGIQRPKSYTPTRCEVCGLTQKECQQLIENIHGPIDPNTCYFYGPHFIDNTQLR